MYLYYNFKLIYEFYEDSHVSTALWNFVRNEWMVKLSEDCKRYCWRVKWISLRNGSVSKNNNKNVSFNKNTWMNRWTLLLFYKKTN